MMRTTSPPASDRLERDQAHRLTIGRYLRKPETLSLLELKKWYEAYIAEIGSLELENDHVKNVRSDDLNEASIEDCIVELSRKIHVQNGFCKDCQDLFNDWPDLGDPKIKCPSTGKYWPGTGADWKHAIARDCHTLVLEAAGRSGCKMCAFLVQQLKDCELLATFRRIEARLEYLDTQKMASLSVQNWGENSTQLLWINFPGKINEHCNSGVAQVMHFESAALEANTDTYEKQREVLDIAKSWLNSCSQDHEKCKIDARETLPTRLISIAGDTPHLVLTEGWQSKPRFSTLSHRWGTDKFLKLNVDNYESFLTRIPAEELPKTFRDAIKISRKLGLNYLWIDSLCILQDDVKDWQREVGLMSSVYGGSFVNIAAASATSVHEGCLIKDPYLVDGLRARVVVKEDGYIRDFRHGSVYYTSVTNSHLATRAWTLQERILPTRTIHFGKRGAFWECRVKIANHFLPDGFPSLLGSHLISQMYGDYLESWWAEVVRIYSAANLTFETDKLPAISGIARRISHERGGEYLAGIWRDKIEAQMCWQVAGPQERPSWRAPSWTWASINGRVHPGASRIQGLDDVYMHVLNGNTEALGDDVFGAVRGGSLRLSCKGLLAGSFTGEDTVKLHSDDQEIDGVGEIGVILDCIGEEQEMHGTTIYLLPILGGQSGAAMRKFVVNEGSAKCDEELNEDKKSTEGKEDENEENWICEYSLKGVVLSETEGSTGQFRRLGYFGCWKDGTPGRREDRLEKEKNLYEPFLRIFEQHGGAIAKEVCAEVIDNPEHPTEKYVITLV